MKKLLLFLMMLFSPCYVLAEGIQDPAVTQEWIKMISSAPEFEGLSSREAFADIWINVGIELHSADQYNRALYVFTKAIETNPQSVAAHYYRGTTYYCLHNNQQALRDFSKAIALNGTLPALFISRGIAYRELRDYQHAIADFDMALELQPDNAHAYDNRGLTYAGLGYHQQALRDFERAIEINPVIPDTYRGKSYVYNKLGDHQRAIENSTKAVQLDRYFAHRFATRIDANHTLNNIEQMMSEYLVAARLGDKPAQDLLLSIGLVW